jgi:uncharacterized protein YfaT (DUF1175 family)
LAARKRPPAPAPTVTVAPAQLWADGNDSATLRIGGGAAPPRVWFTGDAHVASLGALEREGAGWTAEIRAGVLPGAVRIHVAVPGAPATRVTLATALATRDSREDGTPDFLRLTSAADQAAFRRWFTYLAEAQYVQPPQARPAEIQDCAALIRYAYREALRAHDGAWATAARLPVVPAFASPGKYEYPFSALGASLFRVTEGPFRAGDLKTGAFAQFADAKTLWRFNTHLVSRQLSRALAGDLLFYRQLHADAPETFHSMIFLGASQIEPRAGQGTGSSYVLYHTGPRGDSPGEMRRLTLEELRNFPEAEWRPEPENPRFLGVYRWNILTSAELNP